MITTIVSETKGPILSVVSGCLGKSGMLRLWLWNLVPTQVNMLGSNVSQELPSILQYVWTKDFLSCSGNLWRALVRGRDLKLVVYEGSLKQRFEKWGRAIGPEPKAQLGLGTSVPYISPPLIHVRLSRRIKEPTRHSCFESPTARDSYGYGFPLMLFSKDALFRSARFSCYYYLTVREPKQRACWLSLAFVGSFVNRAHLLLIKRFHVLFRSYKQFSLEHSFTFSLFIS